MLKGIIAARLIVACLRELLGEIRMIGWLLLRLLACWSSWCWRLIWTQKYHLLIIIWEVLWKYAIVCTSNTLIIGCCLWSIDHHIECLVHSLFLLRMIRCFFCVSIGLRLSDLIALRPDEPILFVANFWSNSVLKWLINDARWWNIILLLFGLLSATFKDLRDQVPQLLLSILIIGWSMNFILLADPSLGVSKCVFLRRLL